MKALTNSILLISPILFYPVLEKIKKALGNQGLNLDDYYISMVI